MLGNRKVIRSWVVLTLSLLLNYLCIPSRAQESAWVSLIDSVVPNVHAVEGKWSKSSSTLSVAAASGARLLLPVAPTGEYEFRITFTRKTGQHSIGAIVVQGGRQVAFELDAWGQHLAGFQDINGQTIQVNPTRKNDIRLENGKRYTMTIEVRRNSLRSLLDGKELTKYATDGSDLSLSNFWTMPNSNQLGLISWESATDFHDVSIRSLGDEPIQIIKQSQELDQGKPQSTQSMAPARAERNPTGKRVLIVIANHDFFYCEYAEPRAELERQGISVTVAAGRKQSCRPHQGSGEGSDGGVVTPDLALKDVKASDFDAILFSGGWGASMYQFAFQGRYDNEVYNGDRAIKAEANRIINEFVKLDKFVCALCNGVSVLAWARVDGRSPLAGKRVCAPAREAPTGTYNGRRAQPACSWHPEQNGAKVSAFRSIGRPDSSHDDVMVDGKIITGEDDPSAREMGRKLSEMLLSSS